VQAGGGLGRRQAGRREQRDRRVGVFEVQTSLGWAGSGEGCKLLARGRGLIDKNSRMCAVVGRPSDAVSIRTWAGGPKQAGWLVWRMQPCRSGNGKGLHSKESQSRARSMTTESSAAGENMCDDVRWGGCRRVCAEGCECGECKCAECKCNATSGPAPDSSNIQEAMRAVCGLEHSLAES
jgi:hypothetical protein